MTASSVPIPGTSEALETSKLPTAAGLVHREGVFLGDPETAGAQACVCQSPAPNDYGLCVRNADLSTDAFNRLRVSEPVTLIAGFNEYKINPFNYVTATSGTGTATHSTTTKRVSLATGGTASGAYAIMQSRAYARYNPGKSLLAQLTFLAGATPQTNVAKRFGYFDDSNGIYLEWTSAGVRVVRRSSVSGSVVNTAVEQADWNVDPLNGSGPSGFTLDMTKGQIFVVDLQFLGVGTVRVGFEIDGLLVYVHHFHHSNRTASQPYMATANLPLRWEIRNTGASGATDTMDCICGQVSSEGGFEPQGIQYSASNGVTAKALSTTLIPLVLIRPGPTYNSITNRGWIIPQSAELFGVSSPSSVNCYYQIIWNATLTGASWTAVNTNAMGQYDVTASAVSLGSGVVIEDGYFVTNNRTGSLGASFTKVFSNRPLVNSFDGTTPDTITIAARTLTGTADAYGAITWFGQW